MPRYDLEGQTAIVTGGGSGIGRAIALRLGQEGCNVVVADLNEESATATTEAIQSAGGVASSYQVDVTKRLEVDGMVQHAVARYGRLDIQVNNAGIARVAPLLESDEALWDTVMTVNAKGVLLCAQAAARQMIRQGRTADGRGGRIINNASAAGKMAPGKLPLGIYSASKHAVVGLTRQMGMEWAEHGILVNAVCPGIVDTPMWDQIDAEAVKRTGAEPGSVKAAVVATIPIGRIEQPGDVANLVAFLASADASYITGQAVNVAGGRIPY